MAITAHDEELTPPFDLDLIAQKQEACPELKEIGKAKKPRVQQQHVSSQHKVWVMSSKDNQKSREKDYSIYVPAHGAAKR